MGVLTTARFAAVASALPVSFKGRLKSILPNAAPPSMYGRINVLQPQPHAVLPPVKLVDPPEELQAPRSI